MSTNPTLPYELEVATDSMVERDRLSRTMFYIVALLLMFGIPTIVCMKIANDWFGLPFVGILPGVLAGGTVMKMFIDKFFVRVDAINAFMTVNQLATLLGSKDAYVPYGPGSQFSCRR